MGKVIKIKSKKEPAKPNKHYKLSEASKLIYVQNFETCFNLFLVKPGEFPTLEELESMPVYQARNIMKKLDDLFEEKADQRSKSLTGKTLAEKAANKIDEVFGDLFKDK